MNLLDYIERTEKNMDREGLLESNVSIAKCAGIILGIVSRHQRLKKIYWKPNSINCEIRREIIKLLSDSKNMDGTPLYPRIYVLKGKKSNRSKMKFEKL